jgi:sugar O-acyltransferase (sialic acid O-acetyltransferase NeuD family)
MVKNSDFYHLIVGSGTLGRLIADVLSDNGISVHEIGFIDDTKPLYTIVDDIQVVGTMETLSALPAASVYIGIGNPKHRKHCLDKIADLPHVLPPLIHNSAVISKRAVIGKGAFIGPGCVVGCGSRIGDGVCVLSGSLINQDVHIGDYSLIGAGVNLGNNVHIGIGAHLGLGACVPLGYQIEDGSEYNTR